MTDAKSWCAAALLAFAAAAGVLAGCGFGGDDPRPTPTAIPTATSTPAPAILPAGITTTGVAIFDDVIAAAVARDREALGRLIDYDPRPCTRVDGMDPGPRCAPAEAEGTLVKSFYIAFCPAAFLREDRGFDPLDTAFGIAENVDSEIYPYAVIEPPPGATWATHRIVLALRDGSGRGMFFDVRDGHITGAGRECGSIANSFGRGKRYYVFIPPP